MEMSSWGTNVAHATFSQVDEARVVVIIKVFHVLGIIKRGIVSKIHTGTLYIDERRGWMDLDADSEGGYYVNFSN